MLLRMGVECFCVGLGVVRDFIRWMGGGNMRVGILWGWGAGWRGS